MKLFWGLDNPTFSQENIAEIEKRLESLPQRLKASTKNSPNLSDVFLKLREDPEFVKDMIKVITKKINDGSECQQPVGSSNLCSCLDYGQKPDTNKRFYIFCTNYHKCVISHGEISSKNTLCNLPSTSSTSRRLTKDSATREIEVNVDSC